MVIQHHIDIYIHVYDGMGQLDVCHVEKAPQRFRIFRQMEHYTFSFKCAIVVTIENKSESHHEGNRNRR